LAGPIAMLNQDGGKLHRKAGIIYFYSMMVIFVSSIILSIVRENWFLFMVGIFSCYLVLTGYRALKLKMLHRGQKAAKMDWIILIISLIAGIGLIAMGIWMFWSQGNSFGLVPFIFGGVMMSGVKEDYQRFTVPPTEKNHWLLKHIGAMMGGYIATLTAFLVQNVNTDPSFIAWLAPSVLVTPIIIYSTRKIKKGRSKIEMK
ncbi:MAG: DUF2306 domain-containing protein, partial [Bacteroidia bacterium]